MTPFGGEGVFQKSFDVNSTFKFYGSGKVITSSRESRVKDTGEEKLRL